MLPGGVHVAQVLIAGNGSRTERAVLDRVGERRRLVRLDAGGHEVTHASIVPHAGNIRADLDRCRGTVLAPPDEI